MDIQKDIEQAVDASLGWDELPIRSIEKFGKELSVKTDQGEIFIPARKFFEQYEFRARVFEEIGIILPKVSRKVYDEWLMKWSETIMKDLKIQDSDLIDTIEELIEVYLDETEETNQEYLRRGRPVLLSETEVAFRSSDVMARLTNERHTISNDQLYFILRRMNCESRRVLRNTLRVWVWKRG